MFDSWPHCPAQTGHSTAQLSMPLAALGLQLNQRRAAVIHRGPLASLCRTSKQYISSGTSSLAADWTKHCKPLDSTAASPPRAFLPCMLSRHSPADHRADYITGVGPNRRTYNQGIPAATLLYD